MPVMTTKRIDDSIKILENRIDRLNKQLYHQHDPLTGEEFHQTLEHVELLYDKVDALEWAKSDTTSPLTAPFTTQKGYTVTYDQMTRYSCMKDSPLDKAIKESSSRSCIRNIIQKNENSENNKTGCGFRGKAADEMTDQKKGPKKT